MHVKSKLTLFNGKTKALMAFPARFCGFRDFVSPQIRINEQRSRLGENKPAKLANLHLPAAVAQTRTF